MSSSAPSWWRRVRRSRRRISDCCTRSRTAEAKGNGLETLEEIERRHISHVLAARGQHHPDPRTLDIDRVTLYNKIKKYT